MQIVATFGGQKGTFRRKPEGHSSRFLFSAYTFRGWTSCMRYTTLQYIMVLETRYTNLSVNLNKEKKILTWYNLSSLSMIYQRRYFSSDSLIDLPRVHTRSWGDAQSYKTQSQALKQLLAKCHALQPFLLQDLSVHFFTVTGILDEVLLWNLPCVCINHHSKYLCII